MDNINKKFEDLTKEQQMAIKKAGRRMVIKMLFNGINYGGLMFLANMVLFMINLTYLDSRPTLFILLVAVDVIMLQMLSKSNRETTDNFKETVKKIIK